jgi:hypothetical protein
VVSEQIEKQGHWLSNQVNFKWSPGGSRTKPNVNLTKVGPAIIMW